MPDSTLGDALGPLRQQARALWSQLGAVSTLLECLEIMAQEAARGGAGSGRSGSFSGLLSRLCGRPRDEAAIQREVDKHKDKEDKYKTKAEKHKDKGQKLKDELERFKAPGTKQQGAILDPQRVLQEEQAQGPPDPFARRGDSGQNA